MSAKYIIYLPKTLLTLISKCGSLILKKTFKCQTDWLKCQCCHSDSNKPVCLSLNCASVCEQMGKKH